MIIMTRRRVVISLGYDTSKEDSLISDIDGSDDYWNFIDNPTCENLIENPIYDMSSEGNVYSEISGSPIYDMPIEGSVDLDTWENPSMEEDHSKLLYDHSESWRNSVVKSHI